MEEGPLLIPKLALGPEKFTSLGWTQTYVTQEFSKKLHQNLESQLRRVEAVQGCAACLAPLPAEQDGAITGSVKGTLPVSHG